MKLRRNKEAKLEIKEKLESEDTKPDIIKPAKKAIEQKILNLIQADSRDYCVITKLNKNHIDLFKYTTDDNLDLFFNGSSKELKLTFNIDQKLLKNNLQATTDALAFENIINELPVKITKTDLNLLQKDFESNKINVIDKILNNVENLGKTFQHLNKNARSIENDCGIWPLYIGRYFLKGKLPNNLEIKSPLILYPVEISKKHGQLSLIKIEYEPSVNEKLFVLLKREFQFSDFNIANLQASNDLEAVVKMIEDNTNAKIDYESGFSAIFRSSKSDLNNSNDESGLCIENSSVLGIFSPRGGALKLDLEQIIKKGVEPFEGALPHDKNYYCNEEAELSENLIEISNPLNIYQKYAVRSALNQNTVIHGPPGTGKSEVIANIIINAMINQKQILMVSEKKAALDVLQERLQHLNKYSISIYDTTKNTKSFYDKIKHLGEILGNSWYPLDESSDVSLKEEITSNDDIQTNYENQFKLRKHIGEIINLYDMKDKHNHNFRDYLKIKSSFNQNIFAQPSATIIDVVNNIIEDSNYQDVEALMIVKNKLKSFLETYNLTYDKIDELKIEHNLLIKYDRLYKITDEFKKGITKAKIKYKEVKEIFERYNIIGDNELLECLDKNLNVLSEAPKKYEAFKNEFSNILDEEFLKFLNRNRKHHKSFLAAHTSADIKHQDYILNMYLTKNVIVTEKPLFTSAKVKDQDVTFYEKLNAIRIYSEISLTNKKYFQQLVDENIEIDKIGVLIYFNNWLLKPYIRDLEKVELDFIDSKSYNVIADIDLVTGDLEKLYQIDSYERDVINRNKGLMKKLFTSRITSSLESEKRYAEKTIDIIDEIYLHYLRNRLSRLEDFEKNEIKDIFRLANLKNHHAPSKFINRYEWGLRILFPVWIAKPETVAESFPLNPKMFDYGIYDEASQMFLERAYPLVYRCKINIVSGDEKQLKPSSFFEARSNYEDEDYELNDTDIVDSLLEKAQTSYWNEFHLKNHYRSTRQDLINFSNRYIYDNNLEFATLNGIVDNGIKTINVNGIWSDTNEVEANEVVDQVLKNFNKYDKILVITFGSKQAEYIENKLYNNINGNDKLLQKLENGKLIITNLENVQGNEGDLVILSISYGPHAIGERVKSQFGPLITDGGKNRLNVAITRARKHMIVIKSIYADQISLNLENENLLAFRNFINYVDDIEDNSNRKTNYLKKKQFSNKFESSFYKELLEIIPDEKYRILLDYDVGSQIMEFAIRVRNQQKISLFFTLDYSGKYKSVVQTLENIDKQKFLNSRGYSVMRIEEFEWELKKGEIVNQIKNVLNI